MWDVPRKKTMGLEHVTRMTSHHCAPSRDRYTRVSTRAAGPAAARREGPKTRGNGRGRTSSLVAQGRSSGSASGSRRRDYVMKPMNVAARTGLHLIFEHLKLVPVGVGEPEDRAPVLLLDRVRDLDALLAESCLLLRGVRRGEHESGVPLLRAGVGAEMEVDVRTSRRDRDPVGERGHDPETEFLLPPFHGPFLIPNNDCDGREF